MRCTLRAGTLDADGDVGSTLGSARLASPEGALRARRQPTRAACPPNLHEVVASSASCLRRDLSLAAREAISLPRPVTSLYPLPRPPRVYHRCSPCRICPWCNHKKTRETRRLRERRWRRRLGALPGHTKSDDSRHSATWWRIKYSKLLCRQPSSLPQVRRSWGWACFLPPKFRCTCVWCTEASHCSAAARKVDCCDRCATRT